MPLEDLTGNQTINHMNEAWPLGTDLPDAGDDHLRGIKNAVKNTFPNVTGPVTLTDAQINQGSVPVGSVLAFYQAAAPAGWERVTGITETFGLRIIASDGTTGGTGGGTDNPVVMDKVPSHTHGVNVTSGGESADHSHGFSATTGYMNQNAAHGHGATVNDPGHSHGIAAGSANGGGFIAWSNAPGATINTNASGTGISVGVNAEPTPTTRTTCRAARAGGAPATPTRVSGTSDANGGAANWTPRYLDMILCRRVAA